MYNQQQTNMNTFNLEKIIFERQLYNKCSSYIDNNLHYDLAASDLILNQQHQQLTPNCQRTTLNNNKSNIKKFRKVISNKLKKILNLNNDAQTPEKYSLYQTNSNVGCQKSKKKRLSLSTTQTTKAKLNGSFLNVSNKDCIKLVNFKYNPASVSNQIEENFIGNRNSNQMLNVEKHRRCSDGQLSCGGSSSGHSNSFSNEDFDVEQPNFDDNNEQYDNDDLLYKSSQITHLFSNYQYSLSHNQNKNSTKINNLSSTSYFDCTSKMPLNNKSSYLMMTNSNDIKSEMVQTSTPLAKKSYTNEMISKFDDIDNYYLVNTNLSNRLNEYENDEVIEDQETCDYNNIAQLMDQSTQIQVDSPVLLESTFNTSSCSNLSDDLIILQTAMPAPHTEKPLFSSTNICDSNKRKKVNSKKNSKKMTHESTKYLDSTKTMASESNNWNLSVIRKFHENTNTSLKGIPQWAMGHQLNLAIVNQLYYNPNGNGIFSNTTTSTLV